MRTHVFNAYLLAVVLLCAVNLVAASPVAMVSDVRGEVIAEGATAGPVEILGELDAGVTLDANEGAELVVVYYASGEQYTVRGPATVRVGESALEPVQGKPPVGIETAYREGITAMRADPAGLAQAGVVMRAASSSRLKLISPVSTWVLVQQPVFRWDPFPEQNTYRFELTDEAGMTILETDVEGNLYRLPQTMTLPGGRVYSWRVSARGGDGRRYSGLGEFGVLDPARQGEVESRRPPGGASVADRVLYALWLESLQLNEEARSYWRELAAEREDAAEIARRAQQ